MVESADTDREFGFERTYRTNSRFVSPIELLPYDALKWSPSAAPSSTRLINAPNAFTLSPIDSFSIGETFFYKNKMTHRTAQIQHF